MKRRIKIWYHLKMMRIYGWLAESVEEDPEAGMTQQGELVYLDYFSKYIQHKAKVRELKGA